MDDRPLRPCKSEKKRDTPEYRLSPLLVNFNVDEGVNLCTVQTTVHRTSANDSQVSIGNRSTFFRSTKSFWFVSH